MVSVVWHLKDGGRLTVSFVSECCSSNVVFVSVFSAVSQAAWDSDRPISALKSSRNYSRYTVLCLSGSVGDFAASLYLYFTSLSTHLLFLGRFKHHQGKCYSILTGNEVSWTDTQLFLFYKSLCSPWSRSIWFWKQVLIKWPSEHFENVFSDWLMWAPVFPLSKQMKWDTFKTRSKRMFSFVGCCFALYEVCCPLQLMNFSLAVQWHREHTHTRTRASHSPFYSWELCVPL